MSRSSHSMRPTRHLAPTPRPRDSAADDHAADRHGDPSLHRRRGVDARAPTARRERYAESLALHRRLLREAFDRHGGYEVNYEGDSFFVAFADAGSGSGRGGGGAGGARRAEWPGGERFRVRMGIHTGEPAAEPPKYVGLDVHLAARIMAAGHGGQVLLSEATRALVGAPAGRSRRAHAEGLR